jgi:hypothetical protein
MIPKRFIGENIIHLPTVKTHVFTTTTGAMKNAFGGLLNEHRHWTHPVIHETLVDLLMIQKKIHRGVFAVMDGWRCFTGSQAFQFSSRSRRTASLAARFRGFSETCGGSPSTARTKPRRESLQRV